MQNQGVNVRSDAEYRKIDPRLIYNYSTVNRENPIGYVENGYERNLSTAPTFFNPSQSNVTQIYSQQNHPPPTRNTYVSQVESYQSPSSQTRTYHNEYNNSPTNTSPRADYSNHTTYLNINGASPRNTYLT